MTKLRLPFSWLVIGFGAMLAVTVAGASLWSFQVAGAPLVTKCGCGQWLLMPASRHYWPAAILLVATVGFLGAVGRSLYQAYRRERALVGSFASAGLSWMDHQASGSQVGLVAQSAPFAVTVGFWQPRIYLSRGLLRQLNKSEVAAVIRHEQAHAHGWHPLLGALTQAVARTLLWLPWLRIWAEAARAEQEIAADAWASHGYKHVQPLASALVKLNASPVPAGIAWTPLEARVERLLDPAARLVVPRWWRSVAAATVILGMVGLAGGLAVRAAKATSPITRRCVETRLMCAERARQSFGPIIRMSVHALE